MPRSPDGSSPGGAPCEASLLSRHLHLANACKHTRARTHYQVPLMCSPAPPGALPCHLLLSASSRGAKERRRQEPIKEKLARETAATRRDAAPLAYLNWVPSHPAGWLSCHSPSVSLLTYPAHEPHKLTAQSELGRGLSMASGEGCRNGCEGSPLSTTATNCCVPAI